MGLTFFKCQSGQVFEIRQSFPTGFRNPPTHLNPFAERIEKPVRIIGPPLIMINDCRGEGVDGLPIYVYLLRRVIRPK